MKPVYWVIAIILGVGMVATWNFLQQRGEAGAAPSAAAPAARALLPASDGTSPKVADTQPAADAAPTDEQVAQWIADSGSTDAGKRAAAMTALGHAPRAQALPVLARLVVNAEPAERPLALKSLRDLALAQGDADHAARQAMREVIYHGDDEQLAASAQSALDEVEVAEQR